MGRGSALRFPSRDIWDTDDEADPQQPREAEDDDEREAFSPRQLHLGKVDLRLVARRRLESHEGLDDGSRTHPSHEDFQLQSMVGCARVCKALDELVPRWIA